MDLGADLYPIKLAQVPSFRLGAVEVDPPTRRISRGSRVEVLEPRVMQVLVALAEAGGAVLSRDELIARCWGGRIVGENAINRVISRIRQVASDLGMDCFQLETITKVGYRMVVPAAAPGEAPVPWPEPEVEAPLRPHAEVRTDPAPSRRTVIAGAAVGLAATAAAGGWWLSRRPARHQPTPAAEELFRRGAMAQRQGLPDQSRQAVSFFEQAVRADPDYSEAWGALALAYRHILEGFGMAEQPSLPQRIRSAARRALTLDPGNADAQVALAIVAPMLRHWASMEAPLRQLAARFPDHWLVQAQLGLLLQDVGRLDEGIEHSRRVIAIDPFLPLSHAFLARGLSCADRIQEAESVFDDALRRWPAHPALWGMKFNFLLFHGRAAAAAAFVSDPDHRPETARADDIAERLTVARAIEHRAPEDIAHTIAYLQRDMDVAVQSIPSGAPVLALLGRADLAFAALERYYFGGGATPPPGPYDRRIGLALFAPPLEPYRDDPRYRSLLERVGLEAYWRETGARPDYRRPGP